MLKKYKITYCYEAGPNTYFDMEVYALDMMSAVNAFSYIQSDKHFVSIEEVEICG